MVQAICVIWYLSVFFLNEAIKATNPILALISIYQYYISVIARTSAVKNEREPVVMVVQIVVDFDGHVVAEINQHVLAVVVEQRDEQKVPINSIWYYYKAQ